MRFDGFVISAVLAVVLFGCASASQVIPPLLHKGMTKAEFRDALGGRMTGNPYYNCKTSLYDSDRQIEVVRKFDISYVFKGVTRPGTCFKGPENEAERNAVFGGDGVLDAWFFDKPSVERFLSSLNFSHGREVESELRGVQGVDKLGVDPRWRTAAEDLRKRYQTNIYVTAIEEDSGLIFGDPDARLDCIVSPMNALLESNPGLEKDEVVARVFDNDIEMTQEMKILYGLVRDGARSSQVLDAVRLYSLAVCAP